MGSLGGDGHLHSHQGPQPIGQGYFPVDASDFFTIQPQDPMAAQLQGYANSQSSYGSGSSSYGSYGSSVISYGSSDNSASSYGSSYGSSHGSSASYGNPTKQTPYGIAEYGSHGEYGSTY